MKGSCLQGAPNTLRASEQPGQLAQDVTQVIFISAISPQHRSVKPQALGALRSYICVKELNLCCH